MCVWGLQVLISIFIPPSFHRKLCPILLTVAQWSRRPSNFSTYVLIRFSYASDILTYNQYGVGIQTSVIFHISWLTFPFPNFCIFIFVFRCSFRFSDAVFSYCAWVLYGAGAAVGGLAYYALCLKGLCVIFIFIKFSP